MSTTSKALVTSFIPTTELKLNDEIFQAVMNHIKKTFSNKDYELTPYQRASIAHKATLIFDSASQATQFIKQYSDAKRLADDFNFRFPKNLQHPAFWRYLAVTKEFLRKHNSPFIKILALAHKVEILLEMEGLLKPKKKHLITFEVLMTYTLSAYSGIPVKTLEDDIQLNERVRLFFLKSLRPSDLKWFHEKLETAKSSDIEVPPLSLEARDAGLKRKWYFMKLTPKDPRYGVIGILTDCCLHAKNASGRKIFSYLMNDDKMDMYAICQQEGKNRSVKDPIIMGSYVQRINEKTLLFNAIFGTHRNFADNDKIQDIYTFFHYAIQQLILNHSLDYIFAGKVFCIFNDYLATSTVLSSLVLPEKMKERNPLGELTHALRCDIGEEMIWLASRNRMHLLNIRLGNIATIEQLKKEWSDYETIKYHYEAASLIAEALKARNTDFAKKLMDEMFSKFPDSKGKIAAEILSVALFCSNNDICEFLFNIAEFNEWRLAQWLNMSVEYMPDKVDLLLKKGANPIFYISGYMRDMPLIASLERGVETIIQEKILESFDLNALTQFPEEDQNTLLDCIKLHTPTLIRLQPIFKISETTVLASIVDNTDLPCFQRFLATERHSELILSPDVPYHSSNNNLKEYLPPSSCTALHYVIAKLASDLKNKTLWDNERSFYQFAFIEILQHIPVKQWIIFKFDYLDNEIMDYLRESVEILLKTERCKHAEVLSVVFGLPNQKSKHLPLYESSVSAGPKALEKEQAKEGNKGSLSLR